jgi:hypothetical protein
MSIWNTYPASYREQEVQHILTAVQAGECVSLIGLSGAGKSNLMGFIANRSDAFPHPNALVDCNRLTKPTTGAFFRLIRHALGEREAADNEFMALEAVIDRRISEGSGSLSLLFDRFDAITETPDPALFNNLRSLRDTYKFQLTYVTATRRPLDPHSELAELFYAYTLWLGPLSEADSFWNIKRYAKRTGQHWDEAEAQKMFDISFGYPSLLRAICEAYALGSNLSEVELANQPAVQRRISEFWGDNPSVEDLRQAGLADLPLLKVERPLAGFDTTELTAKEHLLLEHLRKHPDEVCTKDELVQAIWPEDQIYERGIRDDSLAQVVRRLRVKIETDPSNPRFIHTVPGRGYRFTP